MAINKKLKSKSKSQRGGFAKTTTTTHPHTTHAIATNTTTHGHPTHAMATGRHQRGGSPASSLVMADTTKAPVLNDYVVSDRIRQAGYDTSLASLATECNQKGGSPASDMVMENLTDVPQTKAYPAGWTVKGDINSLNLYQTTGGSRRRNSNRNNNNKHKKRNTRNNRNSNNSRRNSRKHKSRNNHSNRNGNNRRTQRGGASDWMASQYSLGNINAMNMSAPVSDFSQSQGVSRNELMNPSTLGLAGSGYPMGSLEGANVRQVGAPIA
jgi:hypothetical protein